MTAVAVRPFQVDPYQFHKMRDLPAFLQLTQLHQIIERNIFCGLEFSHHTLHSFEQGQNSGYVRESCLPLQN